MNIVTRLSKRQHIWLTATCLAMAAIIGTGWLVDHRGKKDAAPSASIDQTIRQLAPKLGATGFSMARELDLPRKVSKNTPLGELGIDQAKLDHVAAHHRSTTRRVRPQRTPTVRRNRLTLVRKDQTQPQEHAKPKYKGKEVENIRLDVMTLLDFRDQISRANVEEIAGCKGDQKHDLNPGRREQ